jgi:hypothetical protein
VLAAHRGTADAAGVDWRSAVYRKAQEEVKANRGLSIERMVAMSEISSSVSRLPESSSVILPADLVHVLIHRRREHVGVERDYHAIRQYLAVVSKNTVGATRYRFPPIIVVQCPRTGFGLNR